MKAKEFITSEQEIYIREVAGKKYISEMARKLKIPGSRIYHFMRRNNIDFKRVDHKRKSEMYFPEGCFNPHERENWLL